jgi:hypothetical protein
VAWLSVWFARRAATVRPRRAPPRRIGSTPHVVASPARRSALCCRFLDQSAQLFDWLGVVVDL